MRSSSWGLLPVILFCASCSSSTPASNEDCAAGEVAVDGDCVRLCRADADCSSGSICEADVCVEGVRANQPSITGITGDGTTIEAAERSRFETDFPGLGELTSHHIDAGILVSGQNLDGAQFGLTGPGADVTLAVVSNDGTTAVLNLPVDLTEGSYTLVAANAAGSDQAQVYVLRGEQGPAGSPDTGAEILTKLAGVDGASSGLDADLLDGFHAADLDESADITAHAGVADAHHGRYSDAEAVSAVTAADLYVLKTGNGSVDGALAVTGALTVQGTTLRPRRMQFSRSGTVITYTDPDGVTSTLDVGAGTAQLSNGSVAYAPGGTGDAGFFFNIDAAPSYACTLLHFEDDAPRPGYYFATDAGNGYLSIWGNDTTATFILRREGVSNHGAIPDNAAFQILCL